jgi:parvulin-like peptidyl-prolyl isomerase
MKYLLLALSALIALAACEKKPVAIVNGSEISRRLYDYALNERTGEHKARSAGFDMQAMKHAVIEQLVADRLLLGGAKEAGIAATGEEIEREMARMRQGLTEEAFKKELKTKGITLDFMKERIRERIVLERFVVHLVPDDSVGEAEIKDYYRHSMKPFLKPDTVLVRFIQTNTEEEARQMLADIVKTGFDRRADAPGKEKRFFVSDYGWVEPGIFGPEIASALKGIKKGSYGGPYKGKEAWFIFRIKDRQAGGPETLTEARDKIKAQILSGKRQATVSGWVADRKSRASIIMNL